MVMSRRTNLNQACKKEKYISNCGGFAFGDFMLGERLETS